MKCIIWTTNRTGYPHSSWVTMQLYSPFYPQISQDQRQVQADHRWDTAREPPAVFPEQRLLETHLLKEEFAPQNEVASIYLKGGSTVTTSPFVVGEAQAAKWNSLLCTFQQCQGCNPAHLFSYCQTNQPKVLGIFLQNITIHKKQGKKNRSISKVCFSTRHLLLEAQLGVFFSLLKRCLPSFNLL